MADDVVVTLRADISDIQRDLNTLRGQMTGLQTHATQVGNKTESAIGGALKSIGPQILAAFSVGALIGFGKQVLEVTSQFQKLEAVLTNTLGSKGAAQKALKDIQDFASKTNFGVLELTQSYVKLANQGFKPTMAELRKLADVANSTGKTFDQLTEALIDAQTGEFERLKEFGIRAKKEGDNVTFAFKGVETQTKFTNDAIRDYILSLGELEGVLGATEAISKTLGGQVSNLGDAWDKWINSIGNNSEGIFSSVIGWMNKLLDAATALNEGLESNSSTMVKVAGTQVEILKFQQDKIQKDLDMILDIEKLSIDAIKGANSDAAVAADKSTANYQKSIAKRLELNKISLELVYKDYNDKLIAGKLEDKTDADFHLRQIYRYEQEREFLEKELPKALKQYRDETTKNIKVKEKETEVTKKQLDAYEQLLKDVAEAEKKIKINAAKGLFNEADIDNVTRLNIELKKVNDEIALQTLYFEKQQTIKEGGTITPIGIENDSNGQPTAITTGQGYNAGAKTPEQIEKEQQAKFNQQQQDIDQAQNLVDTIAEIDAQAREQRISDIQDASDRELQILDNQLKNKGLTEKQYQEEVKALNKRTQEEIRKEKIKQFNIDKALAIANITIDTAQGVAAALASPVTAPFVIPLIAGIGAAQIALVASQQAPKYEKGGKIKGNRHSFGGVLIEAEGGEYISPIHATSKYLPELEAMRSNTFERMKQQEWIQPALKKAKKEYESDLKRALSVNANLNDSNLIISDMKTRDILHQILEATKGNNKHNNQRFRNV